mmetsp:Transcript_61472/g.139162  ORF Transcript_61472/g.139162 Transcript_61472/m.139162 type:complete len:264 (-) Transcript_61472:1634-2425(-)
MSPSSSPDGKRRPSSWPSVALNSYSTGRSLDASPSASLRSAARFPSDSPWPFWPWPFKPWFECDSSKAPRTLSLSLWSDESTYGPEPMTVPPTTRVPAMPASPATSRSPPAESAPSEATSSAPRTDPPTRLAPTKAWPMASTAPAQLCGPSLPTRSVWPSDSSARAPGGEASSAPPWPSSATSLAPPPRPETSDEAELSLIASASTDLAPCTEPPESTGLVSRFPAQSRSMESAPTASLSKVATPSAPTRAPGNDLSVPFPLK